MMISTFFIALSLSLLLLLHLMPTAVDAQRDCVFNLSFQQENDTVVFPLNSNTAPVQLTRIAFPIPGPMTMHKSTGIHECDCPSPRGRSACALLGNEIVGWTLGANASTSTILSGRVQFLEVPASSDMGGPMIPIVGTIDLSTELTPRASAYWSLGLCREDNNMFSLCMVVKPPDVSFSVTKWTLKHALPGSTIQFTIIVSNNQGNVAAKTAQLFVWMTGSSNSAWKTWSDSFSNWQQQLSDTKPLRIGFQKPLEISAVFSDFFGASDTKLTADLVPFDIDMAPSSICIKNNLARAIMCPTSTSRSPMTMTSADQSGSTTSTTTTTTLTTTATTATAVKMTATATTTSPSSVQMEDKGNDISDDLTIPVVLFCVSGVFVIIGAIFVWKLTRN